jgi:hypothetical protein
LVRQNTELQKLEQQFVCVRLVQMKGVDLRLFQFDYDQSWAVFFLNADGTIYGRYGTRAGDKKNAATHLSVPSLKKAMERALELHKQYPANKTELAAKRGPEPRYATAERIPSLQDRARGPTTPQNCIHCHMAGEHLRKLTYREKRLGPADIWIYPLPENLGLKMEVDDGLRVQQVLANSAAQRAGVEAGDELISMNGQPLISQADIQWVLHRAPVETSIAVKLTRNGQTLDKTINVSGNWKDTDLSWRESSWSLRPGLWTIPLSADGRKKWNLPPGDPALQVKWAFGNPPLSKQAGIKDGDIIVAVDGQPVPPDESHFMALVRLNHPPGDRVKLTLLRNGKKEDVLMKVE